MKIGDRVQVIETDHIIYRDFFAVVGTIVDEFTTIYDEKVLFVVKFDEPFYDPDTKDIYGNDLEEQTIFDSYDFPEECLKLI